MQQRKQTPLSQTILDISSQLFHCDFTTNYAWHFKEEKHIPTMCLAGSDKCLCVVEHVYRPLPYKEAFVTCLQWIQIRAEMSEWKPVDAHFPTLMPNTLHSSLVLLVILEFVKGVSGRIKQITWELKILTAQKTGFMPALPLTLHFLSEVDGFLAAATLVPSSERHSVSIQESGSCTFLIHCIYNVWCCSADRDQLQHLRLHTTIPIKGEAPVWCDTALSFPLLIPACWR